MEKTKLLEAIKESLAPLNPNSVQLSEVRPNSYSLKIVSIEFHNVPIYQRYKIVYPLLDAILKKPGIHIEIIPLSIEENQ